MHQRTQTEFADDDSRSLFVGDHNHLFIVVIKLAVEFAAVYDIQRPANLMRNKPRFRVYGDDTNVLALENELERGDLVRRHYRCSG